MGREKKVALACLAPYSISVTGDAGDNNDNKSVQSNLGRAPHCCESKSSLVTTAFPKFAPKSTPSRGSIAKPHYLAHP